MRALVAAVIVILLGVAGAQAAQRIGSASNYQVTCSTTSAILSPVKEGRSQIVLTNSDANTAAVAFICYGEVCTSATGTALAQYRVRMEGEYTGPISCITASSTAVVSVTEMPYIPTTTSTSSTTSTSTSTSTSSTSSTSTSSSTSSSSSSTSTSSSTSSSSTTSSSTSTIP